MPTPLLFPVLGLCISRCPCHECLPLSFPGQFLQLLKTQQTAWVIPHWGALGSLFLLSLWGRHPSVSTYVPRVHHTLLVQLLTCLCPLLVCKVLEGRDPALFSLYSLGPAHGKPLLLILLVIVIAIDKPLLQSSVYMLLLDEAKPDFPVAQLTAPPSGSHGSSSNRQRPLLILLFPCHLGLSEAGHCRPPNFASLKSYSQPLAERIWAKVGH